ncbi:hypothetical protein TNCT_594421 [Trichonephila clavata]|uniref:Uncharacterized protein n=1 Tax=Trichonephila clavata TaxID=2740835 RepID=A0A8X6M068_TRICU|nr:hypothetical protein TNCT_594421 [Trichonephila clavata]
MFEMTSPSLPGQCYWLSVQPRSVSLFVFYKNSKEEGSKEVLECFVIGKAKNAAGIWFEVRVVNRHDTYTRNLVEAALLRSTAEIADPLPPKPSSPVESASAPSH